MNILRCANGHFFDGDKFPVCPHCEGTAGNTHAPAAASFGAVGNDDEITVPLGKPTFAAAGGFTPEQELKDDITVPVEPFINSAVLKPSEKTEEQPPVSAVPDTRGPGRSPVAGWLVAVRGELKGEDWRLTEGRNTIGFEAGLDVFLNIKGEAARRCQAVLIFEPKLGKFYVLPGESRELAYLNGQVLLGREEMKRGHRLEVGDTELMLIPCCDESFSWENTGGEE